MRARLIPPLVAVLLAATFVPAGAAVHNVDVLDFRFEPPVLEAAPGDVITWSWAGGAPHNVTAYAGATWASPTMQPGATYSASFGGGLVRYRCTLHSTLDAGTCNGMCGIVTDDADAPPAPEITDPAPGSVNRSPVRVAGTARPGARVAVMKGGTRIADATVDETGRWSVNVALPDGDHTVHAVARNTLDVEGAPSAPLALTVDGTPPQVAMTQPSDLAVASSPVVVAGTASDERSVSKVMVEVQALPLGAPSRRQAACAACGGPSIEWDLALELQPGAYAIRPVAYDGVLNETAGPTIRVLVL